VKILITGHTGFKGAWLGAMLSSMGHEVFGISLESRPTSLFRSAGFERIFAKNVIADIRDSDAVARTMEDVEPDRIFHLAAQPLVRYSYEHPMETYQTNVVGTLNLLEAASRMLSDLVTVVVVTTDKVYADQKKFAAYTEGDPLGGVDPYSASKAMADLLTQSWIACNPNFRGAIARAGNVIGGGDDSSERLLPDLIESYSKNEVPILRNPNAVRPWQHVLDCLYGYWRLSESLEDKSNRTAWNFGPEPSDTAEVRVVAELVGQLYGSSGNWTVAGGEQPHETGFLTLNSDRAKRELGWVDTMQLEEAIGKTVAWHKGVKGGKSPFELTFQQVESFLAGHP
jgi:CDP-glucose 4,6-dehydratase